MIRLGSPPSPSVRAWEKWQDKARAAELSNPARKADQAACKLLHAYWEGLEWETAAAELKCDETEARRAIDALYAIIMQVCEER